LHDRSGANAVAETTYNGNAAELLEEARDNFDFAQGEWQDIRDEGKEDMRFIAGDPWDPEERRIRENAKRPVWAFDELGQYVNQAINAIREQKRSIKVIPKGDGATDKTAEYRQGRIREIEERSNAQYAYITAYENAISRSYGYFGVTTRFRSDDSFELEAAFRTIPNPDTVLFDPDYKEADQSDAGFCFVTDIVRRRNYKEKFPGAEVADFTDAHMKAAPKWITETGVQTAEYWKVKKKPRTLLLLGNDLRYLDEFKTAKLITDKGQQFMRIDGHGNVPVARSRKVEERQVCQFLLNGVEILEYTEWPGKVIPIVGVFGKEMYVDEGDGPKRKLFSLVRLARDPYALYCWYRTCEAEMVGQVPKVPYFMYRGQEEGSEEELANMNRVPVPYILLNPQVDAVTGQVLPLPRREVFEPPIQAMELGAEAARRAIQAAMSISNLPTAAQRQNEKSGVALQQIETQQQRGSYHFVDNFERGIKKAGTILNDILDKIEDTEREVGLMKPDDTYEIAKVQLDEEGKPLNGAGDHDVTISTGPSFASQREEAEAYLNILARDPSLFARVGDLVTKLKNLGPIGDQIAERLIPPEFAAKGGQKLPPQVLMLLQKEKQEKAALNQYAQTLEGELAKVKGEQQAKTLELESKERIETLKIEAQVLIAEITTKAQEAMTRAKMENTVWKELHGAENDRFAQASDHLHDNIQREAAAQDAQAQAAQAAQAAPATEPQQQP
jgi:hypothetical protein